MKSNYSKFIGILLLLFPMISMGQKKDIYSESIDSANLRFHNKQYLEAAKLCSKAFAANKGLGRADHRYLAGACWAQAGIKDSSFYQLNRMVKGGFSDYVKFAIDDDFSSIKRDIRYNEVLSGIRRNIHQQSASLKYLYKNLDTNIVFRLDSIRIDDQIYRSQIEKVKSAFGMESTQMKDLVTLINRQDSINLIKVEQIVKSNGWMGKEQVGDNGNTTLFLVIQHADLASQLRYLPIIEAAARNGKVKSASLALLQDRVLMRQGKKQLYGSQLNTNRYTGKYYVYEMEDPSNVDKRRFDVGLPPMKQYLSTWGIEWSLEQYERDLQASKQTY